MAYEETDPEQQKKLRKAVMEQLKRQQIEQQKKELVRTLVEPAAYERLMNVRVSNPELYAQIVDLIISLAQQGRLQGKLTETQFMAIMQKITYKPDTKIEFKHK